MKELFSISCPVFLSFYILDQGCRSPGEGGKTNYLPSSTKFVEYAASLWNNKCRCPLYGNFPDHKNGRNGAGSDLNVEFMVSIKKQIVKL